MIGVDLLIWLLALVIIFGLLFWVITIIPLPPPFGIIAQVVLAVILIIVLLNFLLPFPARLR